MKKTAKIISLLLALLMVLTPASLTVQAATAGEIRSKIISVAEKEVGYKGTSSYSKYGEWYGYQGGWCTTFALWVFNKAGQALNVELYGNIVPSGGNCNSMISWFKNKGRYHTRSSGYKPKKGDLVFFDWSGNGSSQHVGIVNYVESSTVYTIEGNCSAEVKKRKYTTTGSKPYNNVSSIMGYGSPDFDKVANGKSQTEKKTEKKTTATTKKVTTTKKKATQTTKKPTTTAKKQEATKAQSTTVKASEKATTTTTTTTTKPETTVKRVKSLKLHAATNDLQIGDSVQLDYSLSPADTKAVVGYFCDEENIIEISNGGMITAIGEGTATVVVCANDEIYSQCDFVVTQPSSDVTKHGKNSGIILAPNQTTTQAPKEKTREQRLSDIGLNIKMLQNNKQLYIVPLCIAGTTLVLSALVAAVKAVAKKKREKDDKHLES
ncbi:MAG: CHAP domain-containing protein [Eubacterium sp.]